MDVSQGFGFPDQRITRGMMSLEVMAGRANGML